MSTDYESILCVKNEVMVFKIPPRQSNRGYRAADWKLDEPDWTGRMRIVALGKDLFIKLEDKNSGELFAQCPVETYPSVAVEAVIDSSRYFVLRIKDDGGRSAFIGIGFNDRGDSFDLNVALQDHFKWLKNEEAAKKTQAEFNSGPKLDLGFKEGQTIKINIQTKKDPNQQAKSRPKGQGSGGGFGMLPPPPGAMKLPPPPGGISQLEPNQEKQHQQISQFSEPKTNSHSQNISSSNSQSNVDLLFDSLSVSSSGSSSQPVLQPQTTTQTVDPWGDFTGVKKGGGK
ncbi:NECAP-like protein CG9132 isoform X2 [Mytilus californianus]|uniref:NECAP-like protein CG9132 isoform X2 n=1 Tax=Mytilus californianus TaxID=6549 RepID=UPI0022455BF6|nr:NECAP-like protein CG9132 isoform X2 [Mytilus californianus]